MELRYMGFRQNLNQRIYQFDRIEKGEPTVRHLVTADLTLFLKHHVGIQEGPTLCARKLVADLDSHKPGRHELTGEDLREYAADCAAREARRAEARRGSFRRRTRPPEAGRGGPAVTE